MKNANALSAPVSLLETIRALDGSKENRFIVAEQALTLAYTCAMQYGNKTQLKEMLESTGKKVCERAMRSAVQIVGVLALHKDVSTRADAIALAVHTALDIFGAIACKPAAAKQPKAVPTPAPSADAGAGEGDDTSNESTSNNVHVLPVTLSREQVLIYAAAQSDMELAALADALHALIEARMPQQQAA